MLYDVNVDDDDDDDDDDDVDIDVICVATDGSLPMSREVWKALPDLDTQKIGY